MENNNDNSKKNNESGKFIPAYKRDNITNSNNSVNNINNGNKKEKKIKSKISIVIMILVSVIFLGAIIFGVYTFISNNIGTNVDYFEDMKTYGFDVMYDNKTAEPKDIVTKSELIKMVVTSMLNESNIKKIVEPSEYIQDYQSNMNEEQIESKLSYKNELWVNYAVSVGIVPKNTITKDNANDVATYLEALVYFANAKVKILNKILDVQNIPNIKNYDLYSFSEQLALSDMIYNKIISEEVQNLNNDLTKDVLNKLLIDMVLEYNTITVEDEKININKSKEPNNVDEYPYTLASIDKSIYELKNYVENDSYKNAKEIYADTKKYYNAINTLIQEYMNIILNVDYTNLDENEFTNDILDLSFHYENSDNLKAYVEYVKSNKIQLTGSAKVQYPAIYYDGQKYRVRVKVEYKILNAVNKVNLIYGDLKLKDNVIYDKDEDSIIIDVPIKKSMVSEIMYINLSPLSSIKAGKVNDNVDVLKSNNDGDNYIKNEEFDYTDSEIVQEGGTIVIKPK